MGLGSVVSLPAADEPRRVVIIARNWEFQPAVVTLRAGETVDLVLESEEGTHGFYSKGLRTERVTFRRGEPALVRVTATRPGSYPFRCSRYCGKGHKGMKGEIVVHP